jgi:hypothetical protein
MPRIAAVSAQPLAASNGLSGAEVVHLIVFAANADLRMETSATEDGSQYATLRVSAAAGLDDLPGTWVVSREQGLVTAFNERSGRLPYRATVSELLTDLKETLPAERASSLNRPPAPWRRHSVLCA